MSIFSIDIGSSYTNVVYGDDPKTDRMVFPTLITEVKVPEKESVTVDNKHYLVGYSALSIMTSAPKSPNKEIKFHGSHLQKVIICYALERSGVRGDGTVLIRSIPYRDRDGKIDELQSEKEFQWSNDEGVERKCNFQYVNIIAQGVGALRCYQLLNRNDNGRYVLLAEIGSQTIDLVALSFDETIDDYRMVHEECDSLRSVNVGKFMDWLNEELVNSGAGEHNMSFHDFSKSLMEDKYLVKVKSGDSIETVNFSKEVQKVKKLFTRMVFEALQKHAGSTMQKADRIILAGGGAGLIEKDDWPMPENTRYLNSWADSVGQYHKVKEMLDKSDEENVPD